jgi:hypothetical protein
MTRTKSAILLATSLLVPFAGRAANLRPALAVADPLAAQFRDPPDSARPRVWWHWMNGNISKEGIDKDLAWMKRVGIGGAQTFDASLMTPQIVDKRLVYMTPEWKDAFRHAAARADALGLELAIASSPGWSETGGPWVPPQDGLKKLVWSETDIAGGRPFAGRLAPPPSVTGPFQAVAGTPDIADALGSDKTPPTYYADVAVLAYPVSAPKPVALPRILSADGEAIDGAAMFDADPATFLTARGEVRLVYDAPQTIASATLYLPGGKPPIGDVSIDPRLEASDDGTNWRSVAGFEVTAVPTTVGFAPVTARMFRLRIAGVGAAAARGGTRSARIGTLALSATPLVDRFEAKAGFAIARDYDALAGSTDAREAGIAPDRVIDLTTRLRPDATLDWTPPKGHWRVVRLGYSLVGTRNHPATAEATGLEVDKFDGAAVRRYLDTYLGMYRDTTGPDLIGRHGVRALLTDSIEVGASNWTPRMIEQFRRLRGYDPTRWLPTLTGTIIGSRAESDAFLRDYRLTLADLMASEHYGTIAKVAHEHGLIVYGEALEDRRPSLGDDMAMRSHADVPMAAMWTYDRKVEPRPTYIADIKGAASVAHIYGQNIVAAESLTASQKPWAFAPADLRPVIDLEFATGVNRPVIHTSVHQPVDDRLPGLSLYHFGQYFNCNESWAEMARPWVDYMARNGLLLQQGRNVADVAYFYGEEGPLTGLFGDAAIAHAPTRHGYDFVNAQILTDRLTVEDRMLVASGGARYRLLYLGGASRRMTLPTLRRLATLVAAGAVVLGDAPTGSPALGEDGPEYRALVKKLWGGGTVGLGRVIAGDDIEGALKAIGVAPDFDYAKPQPDSEILFAHRALDDGDLYFVDNRRDRAEAVETRFRVTGKAPEIWHADTGRIEPVSYRIEGNETVVPLGFDPDQSYFVVFRKPAATPAATIARPAFTPALTLDGPWDVTFQPGRGAPAATRLAALGSLSEQTDPAIRYFSGIATYAKRFTLPRGARLDAPLMLDLGKVGDVAEVVVNGHMVGTAWHAPYRIDIGGAVRRGPNRIEVRVADLWVNRLIGDAQPGAAKITYTSLPIYRANAPLRPSGLIGPVTLSTPSP